MRAIHLLALVAILASASPNIVLFITDDQSWDSIGFMGGKVHTPRLDHLAQEGMLLTDFNVTSTVCSPSRYSFLTGRFAGRCQGPHFLAEHPPGEQTQVENIGELEPEGWNLARALQKAGYSTGFVGKSHIVRHDWLEEHGGPMERYAPDADPRDPETNAKLRRNHQRWCREIRRYGFDYADGVYAANLRELFCEALNVHNLDWTIDRAFRFLEANHHRPFFLYLSTTLHHGPAPWANRFSLAADPRMTGEGFVPEGFDVLPSRQDVLRRNRKAGFKDRDAYALWLDDGVGAILDKLDALGVAEDTLFIFVPDHGSFRHGKATLYDFGMRVPMMLRWPRHIAPASRYDGLLANIDLAPTLLDICGISPPAAIDGRSFKAALFGSPAPIRDLLFAELGHSRAVKSKTWKYIAVRYPPDLQAKVDAGAPFTGFTGEEIPRPYLTRNQHLGHYAAAQNPHYFAPDQLYDLRRDPEETVNRVADHPEVVRDLRKKLAQALRAFPGRPFGEFTAVNDE
jgi:arylsulfatase A-like enzyme